MNGKRAVGASTLVALVCASPAAVANARPVIGVNTDTVLGPVWSNEPGYTADTETQFLGTVRSIGITTARGVSRQNNWAWNDRYATALAQHGIRWSPVVLAQTPARANMLPNYVRFARAFVRRYGPGGTFWHNHQGAPVTTVEVGNEPDIAVKEAKPWHRPGYTPQAYAKVFNATYAAIKSANPRVSVATAGLVVWNTRYAHALLRLIHPDALALHTYAPAGWLQPLLRKMERDTTAPILADEFGWTIGDTDTVWMAAGDAADRIRAYRADIRVLSRDPRIAQIQPWIWPDGQPDWMTSVLAVLPRKGG